MDSRVYDKRFTLRLPKGVYKELEWMALSEKQKGNSSLSTVNKIVNKAIEEFLKNHR